jgi:3-hydroxyisobutyrate dehydrogenase
MTDALNRGAGRNQTTDKMLPAIARGEASTRFALSLMLKDVNQAVALGLQLRVPMPLVGGVRALLQAGLNTRGAAAQLEDMIGVIETMAGTRLAAMDAGPQAADASETLALIDASVAAVCRAISGECLAAGLQYGLAPAMLAAVLNRTSGWSAALEEMTAPVLAGSEVSAAALGAVDAALRRVMELAMAQGAPVMLAQAAGALVQDAVAELGASASVDLLARRQGCTPRTASA